jgi:hypothetical protein
MPSTRGGVLAEGPIYRCICPDLSLRISFKGLLSRGNPFDPTNSKIIPSMSTGRDCGVGLNWSM